MYDKCIFLNEVSSRLEYLYSKNKMDKPKFLDIKKTIKNGYKYHGFIGALLNLPIEIIFRIPEYILESKKYKEYISRGGDKFLLKKFVEDNIKDIKEFYNDLYIFNEYKKDLDSFIIEYVDEDDFDEILEEQFFYEGYNPFDIRNEIKLDEIFIFKFKDQFNSKDLNNIKKAKSENDKILAYTYKKLKEIKRENIVKEFNDAFNKHYKKEEQFLKSLLSKID